MDAVEFLDKVDRLSKRGSTEEKVRYNDYRTTRDNAGAVKFVEQWAAAHPIKTRMSVFLEQWPDARIHGADGLPFVSPCYLVDKPDLKCTGTACPECRKEFWLAEVEE